MTEVEFQQLAAQGYTRIPVIAEARADLYTPLALYIKLANAPFSYLLDSWMYRRYLRRTGQEPAAGRREKP